MKQHKNILLIILLAASALAVLGLSFQVGKMLSLAYKETTVQAPAQENLNRGAGEIPPKATAPKVDSPAVKEAAKSGTVDSASKMAIAPAPGSAGKPDAPAPKKDMAQRPAEAVAKPVSKDARAEKPATAKPAATAAASSAPAVQPATKPPKPAPTAATAPASTVETAAKPPEPAPEQKMVAKAPKKSKEYKVVAESFSAEADAAKLADRLKAENYQPVIVPADLPKGRYYRVIVGSHGSLNEARAEMTGLKKLGLRPFCIVE